MDCQICCSKTSRLITCPNCSFGSCTRCTKTYLESSIQDRALCCNCKIPWDDAFLVDSLSQSWFLGDYRKTRKAILCERQKALFPATMVHMEERRKRVEHLEKINELKQRLSEAKNHVYHLEQQIDDMYDTLPRMRYVQSSQAHKRYFRCSTADCKGFFSSDNHVCAVCNQSTCYTCLQAKTGPEHECDPEHVASAETLKKATVACPSCHVRIQKSEGCDQMFCTQCMTAFSYRTGEIVTGVIHNPHYYQMMHRMNRPAREPGDVPCGGFPEPRRMNLTAAQQMHHNDRIRILNHVTVVELPGLVVPQGDRPEYIENRVKFMANEISEEEFAKRITRLAFEETVKRHYSEILRAFVDSCQDIYARLREACEAVQVPPGTKRPLKEALVDDSSYIKELDSMVKYTNEAAEAIGKRYKRVHFRIPTRYGSFLETMTWGK